MPDYRSAEAATYRRWYSLARWKRIRAEQLKDHPICKMCLADGIVTAATVCDHAEPHRGDEHKFWNGPFQSLCKPHHDSTKQGDEAWGFSAGIDETGWPTDPRHMANGGNGRISREYLDRLMPRDIKPSAIPVTIVCGPPGSGKSTYVRDHKQPRDIVIDLDAIMQRLSGLPEHHTSTTYLTRALNERNKQLRSLATNTVHRAAWFIVSAPKPTDRAIWRNRLGGEVVTMATPLDECIRRINVDPAREGQTDRMIAAAKEWWAVPGNR